MNLGFTLWAVCCAAICIYGVTAFFAKKPYGFWANSREPVKVDDVKGYNNALGRLFIVYGILLCLCGIPLLGENKTVIMLVTILAASLLTFGMVVWYVIRIEEKFKVK